MKRGVFIFQRGDNKIRSYTVTADALFTTGKSNTLRQYVKWRCFFGKYYGLQNKNKRSIMTLQTSR